MRNTYAPSACQKRVVGSFRELQEMCQNELATATGIPQSTISAIENGRVRLGVECAKVIGDKNNGS